MADLARAVPETEIRVSFAKARGELSPLVPDVAREVAAHSAIQISARLGLDYVLARRWSRARGRCRASEGECGEDLPSSLADDLRAQLAASQT